MCRAGRSQPSPCCLLQNVEGAAKRGRREGEAAGSPERGQEGEWRCSNSSDGCAPALAGTETGQQGHETSTRRAGAELNERTGG